jgi:hypothetical protein
MHRFGNSNNPGIDGRLAIGAPCNFCVDERPHPEYCERALTQAASAAAALTASCCAFTTRAGLVSIARSGCIASSRWRARSLPLLSALSAADAATDNGDQSGSAPRDPRDPSTSCAAMAARAGRRAGDRNSCRRAGAGVGHELPPDATSSWPDYRAAPASVTTTFLRERWPSASRTMNGRRVGVRIMGGLLALAAML